VDLIEVVFPMGTPGAGLFIDPEIEDFPWQGLTDNRSTDPKKRAKFSLFSRVGVKDDGV
jgi:hypothetical protein